jgi:hypothetical protein
MADGPDQHRRCGMPPISTLGQACPWGLRSFRAVVQLQHSSGENMTITKPDHHLVDNVTDKQTVTFCLLKGMLPFVRRAIECEEKVE